MSWLLARPPERFCVRAYAAAPVDRVRLEEGYVTRNWMGSVGSSTAAADGSATGSLSGANNFAGLESAASVAAAYSPRTSSMVTRCSCGPVSERPAAAARGGMASPARISVCLSELTLTAKALIALKRDGTKTILVYPVSIQAAACG